MQVEIMPSQVHHPDPMDTITSPNDYPRGSFLADPSTPGYSDGEWKAMVAMHSSRPTASLFSSPDARPLTPKADSFTHSDMVSKHLLIETALLDGSKFDILNIDEVDSLKKEKHKVDARIEAARRKLALESKVRDAAQSLHRLYATKGRPTSQRRQSLLGGLDRRGSGSSTHSNSDTASQAEDELASSTKKIDEIVQILLGLENRRQYIESRLLRHTAAVLQAAHAEREAEMSQSLQDSGFDDEVALPFGKDYDESIYSIHHQGPQAASKAGQDGQLSDVNMRLQLLNGQLRSLISQAKRGRAGSVDSNPPDDVPSAYPEDEDAAIRLNNQLEHMQQSILTLVQEHKHMRETHDSDIDNAKHEFHALEGRLEGANAQLYNLVSTSTDAQSMFDIRPPPQITGHGAREQIDYLDESLLTVEQILQQSEHIRDSHHHLEKEVHEVRQKASVHADKAEQFETTLLGLWDILCSDDKDDDKKDGDGSDSEDEDQHNSRSREPFTLPAFSNRVQRLFQRVTNLDLQADTLRRQIQQQRDLAGKAELVEIDTRELEEARLGRQEALAELDTHIARVEELQEQIEALEAEHRDDTRIAETEIQAREHDHRIRVEELTAALGQANLAKERAEESLNDRESEMIELESEVVRLTTELTMAKAELDGAYGSRTDRAKDVANNPEIQAQLSRLEILSANNQKIVTELEQLRQEKLAQGNELQDLMARHQDTQQRCATLENQIQEVSSKHQALETELAAAQAANTSSAKDDSRMRALEKELADMANDYQALTRETVEVEKERERTEAVVDSLRIRVEGLEGHLADEKVKWLGVQRAATPEPGAGQREMTSTMVMRVEFKKMMREARADGIKMLRVSNVFCYMPFFSVT